MFTYISGNMYFFFKIIYHALRPRFPILVFTSFLLIRKIFYILKILTVFLSFFFQLIMIACGVLFFFQRIERLAHLAISNKQPT